MRESYELDLVVQVLIRAEKETKKGRREGKGKGEAEGGRRGQ